MIFLYISVSFIHFIHLVNNLNNTVSSQPRENKKRTVEEKIVFYYISNGARLNFGYSNQNWHVAGSCIGLSKVHNCNNLIYLPL
jgi:hypothetical protein